MSQFPLFDPNTSPFIDRSTKTKPTKFYLPNLNLTKEDIEEEKQNFLGFLNNTVEGNTFTQMSLVDHQQNKSLGDYYKLKEDWYSQSVQANPNSTDRVLESWRLDRTDNPLLSVTVAPEGFGIFQPKKLATGTENWDNTDYFTFAGSSTWGALLSKESSAPQFVELLARNAQTNHFAAVRARGGQNGELWQNITQRSPWLAEMFKESETTKESLDTWINSTPSLVNIKASIPFSAYAGETVLDILNDAPIPENWDAKEAIKQLKEADPVLSDMLFREMGIQEETLVELGKNPIQFKFFIADAIDNYAYTNYLMEYSQASGGFVNFVNTMAWPLIRDSFNSNDNFSELMTIGAGLALTASSVVTAGSTAIPGLATTLTGVASMSSKFIRTGVKVKKAIDKYETMSKAFATAGKFNKLVWQAQKVLPSNLTNTLFDASGITKKVFTAPTTASRTRKVLTYGAKQFVGEGAQGVVESVLNQAETMENGFQTRFSLGNVAYNALEEGIGGLALGGAIRLSGRSAANLTTTRVGEFVSRKIGEAKASTIAVINEAMPTESKNNLRLATSIALGIPEGVDFDTYSGAIETELRLNAVLNRVSKTTNFGDILTPTENENPLLKETLKTLTKGNASQDFAARVELLRRIDATLDKTIDSTTGKSTLTGEDIETLFIITGFSQAKGNAGLETKLIESMWLSSQFAQGKTTNKDNKPLSASDMTEEDIKNITNQTVDKIRSFVTKLGIKSAEEVETIFGRSIGTKEEATLKSVIQEKQEEIDVEATSVSIDIGNLPLEGTVPTTLSSKKQIQDTYDVSSFKMFARPGDTISFAYEGGSTPGRFRKVKIIDTTKPGYFTAVDLETNEERQFKYDRVSKSGIKVEQTSIEPQKKSNLNDLTESLLENLDKLDPDLDTYSELTPEEEADLRSRTCYRERD